MDSRCVDTVMVTRFSVMANAPSFRSVGWAGVPVTAAWGSRFYLIYSEAQCVFGVDWLLLASIHM
jgi:hypothetical protein